MTARAGMRPRRIVYVQYTNPAGYPPLEHSSQILAGRGCEVLFLAAAADGSRSLRFRTHPSTTVRRLPAFGAGLAQQFNYLCYVAWTLAVCIYWRPHWVYASEPMACLPTLGIRFLTGCRTLYHEHDTPTYNSRSTLIQRLLRAARRRLARSADICVLPEQNRLRSFVEETGRTSGSSMCVWNCPGIEEVGPRRAAATDGAGAHFYFHGSINVLRLPPTILDALARVPRATLTIVGYETIGSRGYMKSLLEKARQLGVSERLHHIGPLAERAEIMRRAGEADVGFAFMPAHADDINIRHMAGASNKPFDYLAVGTALLVSDLPGWREMYVEPGYAIACDPSDAESLTRAMTWCADNLAQVRAMGEAGRLRIAAEWNYERQFAPVADEILAASATMPTYGRDLGGRLMPTRASGANTGSEDS